MLTKDESEHASLGRVVVDNLKILVVFKNAPAARLHAPRRKSSQIPQTQSRRSGRQSLDLTLTNTRIRILPGGRITRRVLLRLQATCASSLSRMEGLSTWDKLPLQSQGTRPAWVPILVDISSSRFWNVGMRYQHTSSIDCESKSAPSSSTFPQPSASRTRQTTLNATFQSSAKLSRVLGHRRAACDPRIFRIEFASDQGYLWRRFQGNDRRRVDRELRSREKVPLVPV